MALPEIPDKLKNICGEAGDMDMIAFDPDKFKKSVYGDIKSVIKEFGKSKIESQAGKNAFGKVFDILTGTESVPDFTTIDPEKSVKGLIESTKRAVESAARQKLCQKVQIGNAQINIGNVIHEISKLGARDQKTILTAGVDMAKGVSKIQNDIYGDITQQTEHVVEDIAHQQIYMKSMVGGMLMPSPTPVSKLPQSSTNQNSIQNKTQAMKNFK